jgi:hypothetical protein
MQLCLELQIAQHCLIILSSSIYPSHINVRGKRERTRESAPSIMSLLIMAMHAEGGFALAASTAAGVDDLSLQDFLAFRIFPGATY